MERQSDIVLQAAKAQFLAMGAEAEHAIDKIIIGVTTKNTDCFRQVLEMKTLIKAMHIKSDELCLKLLALQSPVAIDLRLVVALIKANNDVERMASQAAHLARLGAEFLQHKPLGLSVNLIDIAAEARDMVHDALDAFTRLDTKLALEILRRDDNIDRARDKIVAETMHYLESHRSEVASGFNTILLARNIERIADHATNIAQDAIFVSTGEDVRQQKPLMGT